MVMVKLYLHLLSECSVLATPVAPLKVLKVLYLFCELHFRWTGFKDCFILWLHGGMRVSTAPSQLILGWGGPFCAECFPVSDLDPVHWWRSGSGLGHCTAAFRCSSREDGSSRENFTVYDNIPYTWPMKYLTLLTFYATVSQIKAFMIGQEGIPRVML